MALDSYAALQTTIGSWLNRSDLTTSIPDFIALAEARFRRELRDWLRFTYTTTNVTADLTLPATISEVLTVSKNDGASGSSNNILSLVTQEEYQHWMNLNSATNSNAGTICFVDVDADTPALTLRFYPPLGTQSAIANLKVEAVKVLPALSASQTTNALLRDAPDVYLYGSLAESAPFLLHDERIPMWEQRCLAAMRGLRMQTERRLFGGSPRPRELDRVFG